MNQLTDVAKMRDLARDLESAVAIADRIDTLSAIRLDEAAHSVRRWLAAFDDPRTGPGPDRTT